MYKILSFVWNKLNIYQHWAYKNFIISTRPETCISKFILNQNNTKIQIFNSFSLGGSKPSTH